MPTPDPDHPAGHGQKHEFFGPRPATACRWCKSLRVATIVDGTTIHFCPHCDIRCLRDPSRCARCQNVVKAGG